MKVSWNPPTENGNWWTFLLESSKYPGDYDSPGTHPHYASSSVIYFHPQEDALGVSTYQALSDNLQNHICLPNLLLLCMFCMCHPLLNGPPWLTVIISNSSLFLAMSDECLQGWGPRGPSPGSTRYRQSALPLPGRKIVAHTLGSLAPGASTIPGAITTQSKAPC